jgi:predicted Zn-dependent peptidase
VSELITKGTETRTAEQISEQIEGVGGSLIATANADFFTISSTVLADHAELAFELMADALLHSTFPQAELELARTRYLSSLAAEKSDPDALATRYFASSVYGDHPYARSMTEASLAAINRNDVTSFAGMRLAPTGALLVISGDISRDRVTSMARRYLGSWQGVAPEVLAAEPPAPKPTEILLVHRPGSAQSNIMVGNTALSPNDDLYYPAVVANKVLGGGADARLFLILREEKGWTYGSYASLARRKDVGFFRATAEVRTEVTDSALTEMLHQLRLMRTEAIPDSELTNAKGYLVGSFPLSIQTPQQVASQVARTRLLGLGDDYLGSYRENLAAVDATAAMNAATVVMRPDSAVVVVVGDGQSIYDKLAAIAPTRIIDADGSSLTPDDLNPAVTALELDLTHLAARRDSFQIAFQGNAIGHAVSALVTEGDALMYWEQTVIPMMGMTQETSVELNPSTFTSRSVDIVGSFGGRPIETHIVYQDDRVSGRAQDIQPTGEIATVDVDTSIVAGTIDLNLIQPLLPFLSLQPGASFTVNAFDAGSNVVRVVTLKVTGTEEVTVPAGTFSAFRITLSGLEQSAIYFVSTDIPHRVVKTELVGQPVSFELVQMQ